MKENLAYFLRQIAGIGEEDFLLAKDFWQPKEYKKGDYYNEYRHVCKYLGFIEEGVFRTYYVDSRTEEEKNVFFYSSKQIVVSYQSLIHQAPCNYYTQAMTDSRILYIHIDHLKKLYEQSHAWERFGRLIAEVAFSISMQGPRAFCSEAPKNDILIS